MFFKFLSPFFGRAHRKKLRAYIRGFALLKNADQFRLIRRTAADLSCARFTAVERYTSKAVFGEGHLHAERITRQYLLQRHAGAALNKAILYSLARKSTGVVYPLPGVWQSVLIKHGIAVDRHKSSLAWSIQVFLYWGYGLMTVAKLAAIALRESLQLNVATSYRYVYFEGLTPANLPQPGPDGRSHDICTWYSRLNERVTHLEAICHGVLGSKSMVLDGLKVEYVGYPFHLLRGFGRVMRFAAWGIKAIAISAVDALRGRWWHALLLAEASKAKAVQLCDGRFLALEYLFHYSGTVYRPMWTYEAEKKGSRTFCYFYSTSAEVKLPEGYESQRYQWGAASWPNYLVWDDYQADVIRRDIDKDAAISVVGPIWFSTSSVDLPEFPEKSIAVFDIEPHRRSSHFGFSTLAEYAAKNPYLNIQFLQDIHVVFSEYGITMVFKKKREIGKRSVKMYKNLVQRLSESKDMVLVDPSISAIKVIERCKAVVSLPFTSTAIYMRDQGIPSIYYDPTGWIQKDDLGAHGIPILSGVNELREWVMDIFKDPSTKN
jgi:polysaccharide biosynthesis PFTS motif protein